MKPDVVENALTLSLERAYELGLEAFVRECNINRLIAIKKIVGNKAVIALSSDPAAQPRHEPFDVVEVAGAR